MLSSSLSNPPKNDATLCPAGILRSNGYPPSPPKFIALFLLVVKVSRSIMSEQRPDTRVMCSSGSKCRVIFTASSDSQPTCRIDLR